MKSFKEYLKEDEDDAVTLTIPPLKESEADVISVDVPLFIRLLEYSKEDARSDLDLHYVAERAVKLMSPGRVLTMTEYKTLVGAKG